LADGCIHRRAWTRGQSRYAPWCLEKTLMGNAIDPALARRFRCFQPLNTEPITILATLIE
jgi:hypothetical protein